MNSPCDNKHLLIDRLCCKCIHDLICLHRSFHRFERTFSECKRKWILHICPFSFTVLYSCLLSLYCFTVLYCLLLFCNNFTVLYCLCQDVLFLLPHADIHHINRIHKKHDNTFCAVDFSGCPGESPYNHTHDDQDDNINDILHEECDRADRSCNTKDQ